MENRYTRPDVLLQELIRFDTSNPPGNEKECILFIKRLFDQNGYETSLYGEDENRPNLVARIKGNGNARPFLMYGHVDVVPKGLGKWKHPPFEGIVEGGSIWGRGALDMKSGLAMMISAILRAKAMGLRSSGDIVFTAVCDEEAGGNAGAKFLVNHHADAFRDIKHAIGEFGGFPIYVGRKKFYPIQIGEKQICWIKGKIKGRSGHGAQRVKGSAAEKLGHMLHTLTKRRLPPHITPIAHRMISTMADNLPFHQAAFLRLILNPFYTNLLIHLIGEQGNMLDPLLHHSVNVTIINGGNKINVIPSEIQFQMDGRLLPGYTPQHLIDEIKHLTKMINLEMEVNRFDVCSADLDMSRFDFFADILKEMDPGATPIPFMLPAMTDARFFSRLGIQTYGFTPMNLPPEFSYDRMIHSENERIPLNCLEFGTEAILTVIKRL